MKTQIIKFMALIVLISGIFSCSDKEEQQLQMTNSEINSESSDNRISSLAGDTLMTSFDVDGLVDMTVEIRNINEQETVTAITLKMEEGIDVTSLAPTITLAPGASIKPESGTVRDFSRHVVYAVTAEDGTRSIYLVISENGPETRASIGVTISATVGGGVIAYSVDTTNWSQTHYIQANTSTKVYINDLHAISCRVQDLAPNYVLEGWYLNNDYMSNSHGFSYPLSNNDTVQARYAHNQNQYSVTVQSENNNRGMASGGGTVSAGNTVRIEASPKPGFEFEGWYNNNNGSRLSYPAIHTFTPGGSLNLVAKFKMTASITGTGVLCLGSSHSFTASAVGTYTWNKSSNLSLSGSGNSVTVSGTSNGSGWVSVIDNFNNQEIARYNVWVGPPLGLGSIYTESGGGCPAGYTTYWNTENYSAGSSIVWGAYNTDYTVFAEVEDRSLLNGYGYGSIYFSEPGTYIVSAYSVNSCGFTPSVYYTNFNVYSYEISFNPKSNAIEVNVNDGNTSKHAGAASTDKFTVTISDGSNIARSQNSYFGKQFTIPTNNLADGTYSVKISNGTITETKELVIKHGNKAI